MTSRFSSSDPWYVDLKLLSLSLVTVSAYWALKKDFQLKSSGTDSEVEPVVS